MGNVFTLVGGMVLLVVGAQGAIRLLADHDNAGVLGWLPGGFAARLLGYLLVVAVGVVLARSGKRRSDRSEAD
ncbi:hypothetical protein BTO20_00280 [Mycobacterium dioxanotrophicus]|jgi:hypothetical protein|uniref:Uncharacterized protein n=1 Tax=Mycobacterium dioxanotrophicus TaxID=482462 RepID=A0A1Y0BWJ0_9MYCO|nr:hypothetical protein [Mycobacterium dioxanotrophicus]ART67266.1 hypothetical protein BTO20_00280 [Mycobacterium dioxanotrophicus]